jgi:hypothetical protein
VGLERGPLSRMSTIKELLGRKSSASGLENREYGRWDPSRWPRFTFNPQKLALTYCVSVWRSCSSVTLKVSISFITDLYIATVIQQTPSAPTPGMKCHIRLCRQSNAFFTDGVSARGTFTMHC